MQALSSNTVPGLELKATKAGFKRIGIATTFVHLDNYLSKPLYVAWGYPKGTKAPYDPFRKAA